MTKKEMTEKEIDELVDELQNDPTELWDFVSRNLENPTGSEVDVLASELERSPLDLREFVINSLEN
ncbi:hypothetical protein [Bacillus cereus]|uniref:hypothetical protein n=1 Tax=Bacillus cereus TaxID=1396 RepID=UPI000B4BAB76|nr:hypothetical protein [Bacillus cereus]